VIGIGVKFKSFVRIVCLQVAASRIGKGLLYCTIFIRTKTGLTLVGLAYTTFQEELFATARGEDKPEAHR